MSLRAHGRGSGNARCCAGVVQKSAQRPERTCETDLRLKM